jgi:predicted acylesterase/phospholipase RssA
MNIEVISIGADLYSDISAAIRLLNGIQSEFRFITIPETNRLEGLTFQRDRYATKDIWAFMQAYRTKAGGQHPLILGFLDRPLSSDTLANLFGSLNAQDGFAVATLFGHVQFVSDPKRYIAYYLVRYALSFVKPDLRSHNDPARKDCYFHKKLYKPDIKASMYSGKICDACMAELDTSTSPQQRQALKAMREVVSGQYPYALIMKGGGIKGLAFAGALLELEKHFSFDVFAGASAGAIASVLLAAGYKPVELREVLRGTNFGTFLDASRLRSIWNLLTTYGLYSGDAFERWIRGLLAQKITAMGRIEMQHLNEAVLYACSPGDGAVVFASRGLNKNVDAAFATRCSMSIPFFFRPMMIEQKRVYDGGMRNNFPVAKFLADNPGRPFLALYLGAPLGFRTTRTIFTELLDIWIGGDELAVVDAHADSVVVIDPRPISTLDFTLTANEAEFLLKAGQAAALRLIQRRKLDGGPSESDVRQAESEADALRSTVVAARRSTTIRRRVVAILLLLLGVAMMVGIRFVTHHR